MGSGLAVAAALLLSPSAASAPAASAPEALTGGVTDLTAHSARLHGTVNPHGADTTYYFQYGNCDACANPVAPYMARTPSRSAGAGEANVRVSALIKGLSDDGPIYHYRLVAVSSQGASYGADRTFMPRPRSTEATDPKLRPRIGDPDTVFTLSLTARHDLGVEGARSSDYRVLITGPGSRCGESFAINHGKQGARLHRRFAPPTSSGWCVGRYEGSVHFESGPYCPPGTDPCPAGASEWLAAGHFSFEVRRRAKGNVVGDVRECNTPSNCVSDDFTVSAIDAAGKLAGRTRSERNHFRLRLLPGSYSLVAESDGGLRCDGSAVVHARRTTHADITCLVP